jgi:hypothetical protein
MDSATVEPTVTAARHTMRPADAGLGQFDYTWDNIHLGGHPGFAGIDPIDTDLTGLSLTLRQDGSYTLSGNFHNNGQLSVDTSLAVVVKDSENRVYTFTHQGHAQGLGDGSRDDFLGMNGTSAEVAAKWDSIARGSSAWQSSAVNFSLGGFVNSLKGALGTVSQVVSVVGPAIALL